MMARNSKNRGFSLIELVIGIAMIIFVIGASMMALKSFNKGSVSLQLRDYANQALDGAMDQLREEAAVQFDSMDTTPDLPRYGNPHYPLIQVYGTVSAIDIQSRARNVTLTAFWTEGNRISSKTINQTLAFTRKKEMGAVLKLRVENYDDANQGLTGVIFSVKGLDQNPFDVVSASGTVQIFGVLPSATGVEVTINGEVGMVPNTWAGFFFLPGEYGNANASYTGKFMTSKTEPGKTLDLTGSPIRMHPPGRIKVRVVDFINGSSPITGANGKVHLEPVPSTLLINRSMGGAQTNQTVDANGYAIFNSLIPGEYSAFFLGSSEYAALAAPGDSSENSVGQFKRQHFTVTSGNEVSIKMKSLKRGSLTGSVRGIRYNSVTSEWIPQTTTNQNLEVKLVRVNSQGYTDWTPSNPSSFIKTVAWQVLGGGDAGVNYAYTNTLGNFSYSYLTPLILDYQRSMDDPNPDTSTSLMYPLDIQYNNVQVYPGALEVKLPLSPIVVVVPAGSVPPFYYPQLFTRGNQYHNLKTGAGGLTDSIMNVPVYANQTNNKDVYLLEANQFANIRGNIYDDTGTNTKWPPGGTVLDVSLAYVDFDYSESIGTKDGFGGLVVNGPVVNGTKVYIEENYARATTLTGSDHTFNMSPSTYKALPPNLSTDWTVVKYMALQTPTDSNINYEAKVNVKTKNLKDISGVKKVVFEDDTTIGSMVLSLTAKNSIKSLWTSNATVGTTPSPFGFILNSKAYTSRNRYRGVAPGVQLNPNDDISTGADIVVDPVPQTEDLATTISVAENDQVLPMSNSFSFTKSASKYVGKIELIRKARTGKIYGHVYDNKGAPLTNVTVTLSVTRNGQDQWTGISQQTPSSASTDACQSQLGTPCVSGQVFQYAFDNVPFVPFLGDNIKIRVTGVTEKGFNQPDSVYREGYAGFTWQKDFNLSLRSAGSPGTGGSL